MTKDEMNWEASSGQSVTTESSYSITLEPEWNQIANPFAFPVTWSNVVNSGSVEAPVGYAGTGKSTSGYQHNQT